jgi:hypothetical protein
MSKKNFAVDDKVYVVLNRRETFAVDNTWGGIQQPPDEMFVAPGIVYESSMVRPGQDMVAVNVDLSIETQDNIYKSCGCILYGYSVFHNEEDAKRAAHEYNEAHRME